MANNAHNFSYNGFREYANSATPEAYSFGYITDKLYKIYSETKGTWLYKLQPYDGIYEIDTDTTGKEIKTIEICGGFLESNSETTWDGTFGGDIQAPTINLITYPGSSTDDSHAAFSIGTLKKKSGSSDTSHIYVRLPNGFIYAPDNEVIADPNGVNCGSTGIQVSDLNNGYTTESYQSEPRAWSTIGITIERITEGGTDKDRVKFYINGKLKTTRISTATTPDPIIFPTTISSRIYESFTTDVMYNGWHEEIPICSIRLYEKVLSEAELLNNATYDLQQYGFVYTDWRQY